MHITDIFPAYSLQGEYWEKNQKKEKQSQKIYTINLGN